jgi:hypothetical protein
VSFKRFEKGLEKKQTKPQTLHPSLLAQNPAAHLTPHGPAPSSGPLTAAAQHLPLSPFSFFLPVADWPGPLVSFPFLLSPSVCLPYSASRAPPPAVSVPSSPSRLQFPSSRRIGAPAPLLPSFLPSVTPSSPLISIKAAAPHGHQWPLPWPPASPLPTPL